MSRILIIETSLRNKSNSDILAEKFAEGARAAGSDVEVISLKGKKIAFCVGCNTCQKTRKCAINDDAREIVSKMHDADVIAFATPIYYYEMSGQMKTLLDRANPLFDSDYKFRKIYFIGTAAEDEEETPSRAISGLNGWIDCFDRAEFAGSVFVGRVTDPEEISDNEKLGKAYEAGFKAGLLH